MSVIKDPELDNKIPVDSLTVLSGNIQTVNSWDLPGKSDFFCGLLDFTLNNIMWVGTKY